MDQTEKKCKNIQAAECLKPTPVYTYPSPISLALRELWFYAGSASQ